MPNHPQKKQWMDLATKLFRRKSPDSLEWMTPEGILVKPLYTAKTWRGWNTSTPSPVSLPMSAVP